VAVAWSSLAAVAIRCVLTVLWMILRFHVMIQTVDVDGRRAAAGRPSQFSGALLYCLILSLYTTAVNCVLWV